MRRGLFRTEVYRTKLQATGLSERQFFEREEDGEAFRGRVRRMVEIEYDLNLGHGAAPDLETLAANMSSAGVPTSAEELVQETLCPVEEREALALRLARADDTIELVAAEMEVLRVERDALNVRLEEAARRFYELRLERDALNVQLEEDAKRFDELHVERDTLAKRLDELHVEKDTLKIRLEEAAKRFDELRIERDNIAARITQAAGNKARWKASALVAFFAAIIFAASSSPVSGLLRNIFTAPAQDNPRLFLIGSGSVVGELYSSLETKKNEGDIVDYLPSGTQSGLDVLVNNPFLTYGPLAERTIVVAMAADKQEAEELPRGISWIEVPFHKTNLSITFKGIKFESAEYGIDSLMAMHAINFDNAPCPSGLHVIVSGPEGATRKSFEKERQQYYGDSKGWCNPIRDVDASFGDIEPPWIALTNESLKKKTMSFWKDSTGMPFVLRDGHLAQMEECMYFSSTMCQGGISKNTCRLPPRLCGLLQEVNTRIFAGKGPAPWPSSTDLPPRATCDIDLGMSRGNPKTTAEIYRWKLPAYIETN